MLGLHIVIHSKLVCLAVSFGLDVDFAVILAPKPKLVLSVLLLFAPHLAPTVVPLLVHLNLREAG